MCGIVGYSGVLNAKDILIKGLYSLEYRGYDSSGISLNEEGNGFNTLKCSGRVSNLEELCNKLKTVSNCGIGHTRWATHGAPSVVNAHPHESDSCVIVHNGIIENYLSLKKQLESDGYHFKSETDTECIVHLIDREYKKSSDEKNSIYNALKQLKGSFAIAVMFKHNDNAIWACRRDNPLIAAINAQGTYLASDIPALLNYSDEIVRPEDDELIFIDGRNITLYDNKGDTKQVVFEKINWTMDTAQKEGFDHFMLKEIYEQPKAIQRAIASFEEQNLSKILENIDSISIIACGSATHAGLVGKYIIESLASIPVFVTTASEYRYSPPVTVGNTLTIAISQSGETADTLAALRLAKSHGSKSLGIINAVGSAIARESDTVIYTNAGPEIAVATTKGYTTQLAVLMMIASHLGVLKGNISQEFAKDFRSKLRDTVPSLIDDILSKRDEIRNIAEAIYKNEHLYFIGRGIDNYACVECSLKLKEISYIHSEAYAAGELKHGTLSLIEQNTPVIAICCDESYNEKMIGNIREASSRGGKVILVCTPDFPSPNEYSDNVFVLPRVAPMLSPILSVVFSQLMAYETAILRGCDVDHPRNLAKSVTVE